MTILVPHPWPNVFSRLQVTLSQQQQLLELQQLISVQLGTIANRAQQVVNRINVSPEIIVPKVLQFQFRVQLVMHVEFRL